MKIGRLELVAKVRLVESGYFRRIALAGINILGGQLAYTKVHWGREWTAENSDKIVRQLIMCFSCNQLAFHVEKGLASEYKAYLSTVTESRISIFAGYNDLFRRAYKISLSK